MFFQKIKKRFGLWPTKSEVSTLTSADTSALTVQSTNVETQRIDGPNFKPFSMVQVIRSGKARLIC